jgi:uncharacterized protein YpuA (DUF1002 family)
MNTHELLTEAAASFLDKVDGTLNEANKPDKAEIQKLIDDYGRLEKLDSDAAGRRVKEALDATYKMSAQQAYDYLMSSTEAPKDVILSALKKTGKIGLSYLVSKYKSAEILYLNK